MTGAAASSQLEDKEAIRDLFSEYCFRLDEHRFRELAELFAKDGEWIARYGQARGRAAIEALFVRNVPRSPNRKHYVVNSIISCDGDRATARASYLVLLEVAGGMIPSVAGTYRDELVRQDGAWLFRRRELVHDMVGQMGLNLVAPSPERT